jgi:hypothetical protein
MKTKTSPATKKIHKLSVLATLLAVAFCCTSSHAFEECLQEVVTQEVELFSARQDVSRENSKRILKSFYRPNVVVSPSISSFPPSVVVLTERSGLNGQGTYLRL